MSSLFFLHFNLWQNPICLSKSCLRLKNTIEIFCEKTFYICNNRFKVTRKKMPSWQIIITCIFSILSCLFALILQNCTVKLMLPVHYIKMCTYQPQSSLKNCTPKTAPKKLYPLKTVPLKKCTSRGWFLVGAVLEAD